MGGRLRWRYRDALDLSWSLLAQAKAATKAAPKGWARNTAKAKAKAKAKMRAKVNRAPTLIGAGIRRRAGNSSENHFLP